MFKIQKSNIAGVVVLYNSEISVVDNIKSYINEIDKLYVVDNSKNYNRGLVSQIIKLPNVEYHSFKENKGISAALNWAADQAIVEGYDILLTMDDDTSTPKGVLNQMIDFWNSTNLNVGILSGIHYKLDDGKQMRNNFKIIDFTLTSGNFLNLNAYKIVGKFSEELFIDHVDHEYGFRLGENKFKVVELRDISLNHNLGEQFLFSIGPFHISYGAHSGNRMYYFTRNGIVLIKKFFLKHPLFLFGFLNEITKRLVKIILFQKDKKHRLHMFVKGLRDGMSNKLGKLEE